MKQVGVWSLGLISKVLHCCSPWHKRFNPMACVRLSRLIGILAWNKLEFEV